jgi:hypothetical protein
MRRAPWWTPAAALLAIGALATCFSPALAPGSPCESSADCAGDLACRSGACAEPELEGVGDRCGAPPCAPNDTAAGALDVTAGGTFAASAQRAGDDLDAPACGARGARDLFYRVALSAPEVYYFDTFGSTVETAVRVYRQPCSDLDRAPASVCAERACGGAQSQLALQLPAGEACVVVEAGAPDAGPGDAMLRVIRGGRDGEPLQQGSRTYTGETCTARNVTEPVVAACDAPGTLGRDRAYFTTTCPGEAALLDADTCPAPAWDPVLYVRSVGGAQLACNDDSCTTGARLVGARLAGGPLYFLVIDGFDERECGAYSLDVSLR